METRHITPIKYNETIVVPENIDAIRTLTGIVKQGKESIQITDEAMGIQQDFLSRKPKA